MTKISSKTVLMYEPSGKGGLARYAMNLSKGLQKTGLRVTLLTASPYEFIDKVKDVYEVKDCLLYMVTNRFHLRFKPFWAADRLYRAWYNANLRNKLSNRLKPDIIHLQITLPIIDALYVPKLARRHRVVYTVHDVVRHTGGIQNSLKLLRRIYEAVDHIIVHTRKNMSQLVESFGIENDKIAVIPHGVESPPANLPSRNKTRKMFNLPQDAKILLFFGSIRRNKGLDTLLQALPAVIVHHPHVKLLVAGSLPRDAVFSKYKKIIKELGIEDNIITDCRFIPEEQVPFYFRSADIVVLPYLQLASQSGVLMQAYSYECPTVVTQVGGIGETVQDDKTGLVVPPGSPNALAQAVSKLLDPGKFYEECVANMRRLRHEKYDWHPIAKKTREVYETVIAKEKGSLVEPG